MRTGAGRRLLGGPSSDEAAIANWTIKQYREGVPITSSEPKHQLPIGQFRVRGALSVSQSISDFENRGHARVVSISHLAAHRTVRNGVASKPPLATPFRFIDLHGDTGHPSNDVRFLRVRELSCFPTGIRVGQEKQLVPFDLAPATRESRAELYEIDGTIKRPFRLWWSRFNFPLVYVDLHKRSWPQEGRQRVIGQTNEAVQTLLRIQVTSERKWHTSPNGRQGMQQVRFLYFGIAAEAQRQVNLFIIVIGTRKEVSSRRTERCLVFPEVLYRDTKDLRELLKAALVNRAEAIQFRQSWPMPILVFKNFQPAL